MRATPLVRQQSFSISNTVLVDMNNFNRMLFRSNSESDVGMRFLLLSKAPGRMTTPASFTSTVAYHTTECSMTIGALLNPAVRRERRDPPWVRGWLLIESPGRLNRVTRQIHGISNTLRG